MNWPAHVPMALELMVRHLSMPKTESRYREWRKRPPPQYPGEVAKGRLLEASRPPIEIDPEEFASASKIVLKIAGRFGRLRHLPHEHHREYKHREGESIFHWLDVA